jgi:multicomponent Na+:H+ antiporter subunit D
LDGIHGRWVSLAFVLGAFSVVGLPPAAGFFAKAALFRTTLLDNQPMVLAMLLFSAALAFLYMFRAYQRRFWPPAAGAPLAGVAEDEGESPLPLQLAMLGLALAIIGLGLWPELLLWMGTQAAAALEVMP